MAKFKRDEARSFGFLWLITGGIFAVLSGWAMWNEIVTRTPWRDEQKEFFTVELDQAKRNLSRQQNLFKTVKAYDNNTKTGEQKLAELRAEQKSVETKKSAEPYASSANELKKLTTEYGLAEQEKTFAKSDLDESYYYRTLGDYARDEAETKARDKVEPAHLGFGQTSLDKAYTDPPLGTAATDCPPRLKVKDNCADLLHLENEVARNKSHQKGSKDLVTAFPDATAELNFAASKAGEVVDRLETEIGHEKRIDRAIAHMLEIDDKRAAAKAKMAPVDDRLDELEREVAKVRRPVEEAERRLKTAEDRANPKFDVANIIGSLVGVYEINQIVSDWNGKMQVDRCTTCHMGVDSSNYGDLSVPRKFRTHPMRSALFASHPVDKLGCTSCHQGQGRSTEVKTAHAFWKLFDHDGEPRWELTGDEYWEEPMLPIGEMLKIQIDARNDTFEADVGTGRFATFTIPRMTYAKETDLLGQMQMLMQAELVKNQALASQWRVRVIRVDNRIRVGLEPLTPEAEALAAAPVTNDKPVAGAPKKPTFRMKFVKRPELGEALGFENSVNLAGNPIAADGTLKCQTFCSAVLPPSVPVRNDDPIPAEGEAYVAPSGRYGLQLPVAFRDRFIQSIPETQSGCLKCHAGDTDLRPHKSKAQWIVASRAIQLHEAKVAACKPLLAKACEGNDFACATKRDECTKLTAEEPPALGEDPDKLADLAPVLTEGRHLFKRLNCTGCHILDGFPGNRNAGPSLDAISAKVSPQFLLQWIRYPRAWRAKTRMPNLWPVPIDPESKRPFPEGSAEYTRWNERMRTETLAIAAYLWDRSEHPELQTIAPDKDAPAGLPVKAPLRDTLDKDYSEAVLTGLGASADEGKKVFETVGCQGCHAIGEDMAPAWKARERDIAPNLGNVGNKMSVSFMAYWIEDPTRYWHGTRMPNLRLSKTEAGSIALFLSQQKLAPKNPAAVDQSELDRLGSNEARKDLAKKGGLLIANYGCFGCHQISGFESYAPIAPELNGFNHKDTHTLDFGYAITNHHQQIWETFTAWKLDSPRIYATDRIELRMGDYDLSPKEIRALMVFLKGLAEEKVRPDLFPEHNADYKAMMEGKDLVEEYNCRGCHVVEGMGSDIAGALKKGPVGLWQSDEESSKQYGPPNLTGEGMRVQPEWLYGFLKEPGAHPIRPFLHPEQFWGGKDQDKIPDDRRAVRMPTFPFDSGQITSIIRYFASWDGQEYPYQTPEVKKQTPDEKLSALIHANSNEDGGVRCVQCHYVGELPRERALADWKALAPNLANASHRLRPLWVKTWVENPKDMLPYTKMPPLWTNTSGDADPFGPAKNWTLPPGVKYEMGDDQIVAIRDFIFSIDERARFPESGKETTSPLVTGAPEAAAEGTTDGKDDKKDDKDDKDDKKDVKDKKDDKGAKGAASGNPPTTPLPVPKP